MGAGVLRGGEEAYAAYSSGALNPHQCTWKASVRGLGAQVCATAHGANRALSVPCGNGRLLAEASVFQTSVCPGSRR